MSQILTVKEKTRELPIDEEKSRDYSHELVGRQIKALYETGWSTGNIVYYNRDFAKVRVDYEDDSDYIGPEEIDGVILL